MNSPLGILANIAGLATFSVCLTAQSGFVYTNDDVIGTNTVSIFSSNAGALTQVGSPVSTGGSGTGGGGYAVNRVVTSRTHLFASNGGSGSVSAFSIDPNSGALTAAGSAVSTGAGWGDVSLDASPNGQFLFAGLQATNKIVVLNIAADGSLSSSGLTATLPASPAGMKVSPDGRFLAVALPALGRAVAMFSIGSNGALSMLNNNTPFLAPGVGYIAALDIDCAASHVFAGEMASANTIVDVFSISSAGVLSAIQGSPFTSAAGVNSSAVLLSANDQILYVANESSTSITAFGVASAATLSPIAGSPFTSGGTFPGGMTSDQNGDLLYVASSSGVNNLIYGFTVAADGGLTPVSGSPFTAGPASGLLSLAAYPAKACAAPVTTPPPSPAPPPPNAPPPVTPPPAGPMTVKIDIRSGDDDHEHDAAEINPKSHGKIQVAILSTPSFSAPSHVDMTSLTFGHTGNEQSMAFCETNRQDVNHDHVSDLVCHFDTQKAAFQKGDTLGFLKGKLADGTPIQGSDRIRIDGAH